MTVFIYGSETMIGKERSRIRVVQMDNFKYMLNALIRELCRMMKGLMKLFLSGSPILNEWRLVGLLKVYI